ncbi:MAG: cobalamin-binding protein [Pseudomonadota bacterium]
MVDIDCYYRFILMRALLFGLLFSFSLYASAAYVAVDSGGQRIELKTPARKIVTLAPNLTEIAFAAGAGKYIIGVSAFSDFPLAAKKLPILSSYHDIDIESLLKLQPDLIIVWQAGNMVIGLDRLKQFHIPIYVAKFDKILDVTKVMLDMGRLAGTGSVAQKQAKIFNDNYQRLYKKYARRKPVSVFYQISEYPLMTLNRHTSVGQVIQLCGGRNIFDQTMGLAPAVSVSSVLQADPQLILLSNQTQEPSDWVKQWTQYSELTAVKHHHIYVVNADWVERYGPRMIKGIQAICQDIQEARQSK